MPISFFLSVFIYGFIFRSMGILPQVKEKMMFPEIGRKEADANVVNCLKFLLNYGFYKFGVEVSSLQSLLFLLFLITVC